MNYSYQSEDYTLGTISKPLSHIDFPLAHNIIKNPLVTTYKTTTSITREDIDSHFNPYSSSVPETIASLNIMKNNRTIGVAVDFSKGSKVALDWAILNFLDKDDTLYVIHVKPFLGDESPNLMWSKTGSPLIPLDEFRDKLVLEKYEVDLDAEVLDSLNTARKQKHATVIVKIYWGDARDKLCAAAGELKLDCLVMGSRGLGTIQRVLLGSVTNYVMVNASCPVTIVKDPAST